MNDFDTVYVAPSGVEMHSFPKSARVTLARFMALLVTLLSWSIATSATDLAYPRLEVFKAQRIMKLFDGDQWVKTYRVALGTNPIPPKRLQGDRATPEGVYFISHKNPNSQFHLSLAISYPNEVDAKRGLTRRLITRAEYDAIRKALAEHNTPPSRTKLGGAIFIHGNGSAKDWTWGCIALDDADIEEVYRRIPVGTPIVIYP